MREGGLTLLELLVALTLSLTVLGACLSWQSSALRLGNDLGEASAQLGALTDVSAYLSSRVRASAGFPDGVNLGGGPCARTATLPCLAVILPLEDESGQLTTWDLYAYRFTPRSTLPAVDRTGGPALDALALSLVEERYRSTCPGTAIPGAACFTGAPAFTRGVLGDTLTLTDVSGTFAPFTVAADESTVTLGLRVAGSQRGRASYTPRDGPYRLVIAARNVRP